QQGVHSGERQDQTRIHGRVPGRGTRRAGIRRGTGGEGPIRDRSRGQSELPERRRRVGQFDLQNLPRQRQPKLRQDPERRVYVRKGLGGGGGPRAQATGRCDLTSPPAQECFSVVTVPSPHPHRFQLPARAARTPMIVASVPVKILLGDAVTGTATEKRRWKASFRQGCACRARRDWLGYARLAQPRAAAIKVMRAGG